MWKKKTDGKHIQQMTFTFTVNIDVDSSLSDEELPASMLEKTREAINDKKCKFVIKRVTRTGDGVVECMSVDLGTTE